MKGLISKALAAAACLAGLAAGTGCYPYRNMVDPCWPERYNHTSRRQVVDAFAPQVQNGHILDQTLYNYHFDKGTDKLHPLGIRKLQDLARRRPAPDANLFLATAWDVTYNPEIPESAIEARRELDQKRVAAIQRFLAAHMAGRPMQFEVAVHDPYEVGGNGTYAAGAFRLANANSQSGPLGGLMSGGSGGPITPIVGGFGGNQTGQMGGGYGGGTGQGGGNQGGGNQGGGNQGGAAPGVPR